MQEPVQLKNNNNNLYSSYLFMIVSLQGWIELLSSYEFLYELFEVSNFW